MMTFGFKDGYEVTLDCDVSCIQDGDNCYQLIVFPLEGKATNTFILDDTQKSRDELFEYVRSKGVPKNV
jgi:hypothetical protein